MISKALLKMNSEELNNGIWRILNIYKNSKFDLSKKGFKKFYTIIQHIENFRNLEKFCINYTLIEGCSNPNCTKTSNKSEFFSPSLSCFKPGILLIIVSKLSSPLRLFK